MSNDNQLQRFIDEASIRNVIARFADAATRGDLDTFRTVWDEQGEFKIGEAPHGQHAIGVDDAVGLLGKLLTGLTYFVQFAIPGVIEVEGDEATTRTFVHESARGAGDHYYRNHCIAFDRLRRAGDDWVFTSRSFQISLARHGAVCRRWLSAVSSVEDRLIFSPAD